jgi:hypothetical protein
LDFDHHHALREAGYSLPGSNPGLIEGSGVRSRLYQLYGKQPGEEAEGIKEIFGKDLMNDKASLSRNSPEPANFELA